LQNRCGSYCCNTTTVCIRCFCSRPSGKCLLWFLPPRLRSLPPLASFLVAPLVALSLVVRLQESITTTPLESHHFSNQLIISSIIVNCCRNLSILLLANAKQVHRPSFLCLNHEAMDLVTFQFILWSHNYSTSSDSR
jgi:hypothetical protein